MSDPTNTWRAGGRFGTGWQAGAVQNVSTSFVINTGELDLASIATHTLLANSGTATATPAAAGVAGGLDFIAGFLSLGTIASHTILANSGTAGAVPAATPIGGGLAFNAGTLTSPSGTVTQVVAGSGLAGGTITNAGTISLGTIAAGDLMGNPGTVAAVPGAVAIGAGLSLSALGTLSNTGIVSLAAGTNVTITNGNTISATGGGGGVTSVVAGSGLSGGTITTSGTIALGTIAAGDLMGNPGTAAAVPGGVAIGTGLSLSAGGTLSSTGSGGTVTQVVAGTGLTGGTISATGTIALDPLGNGLVINSGTIDYNQTPTAFSASRTLAAADNGLWLVDSSGGTVDVIVTTPTFTAGTKFTAVLQNNSTTHNVILRPGAGATIDGVAGDYPLHTFTSSRIGIDSTGAAWVAEPGNIFWQPSAGYVTALGANLSLSAGGTLSAVGSAGVARIASIITSVGNPANTSENTLQTINLAAGQLASDGQAIRIRVGGQYTGASATKTLNVYFGATKIATVFSTVGVDQILFDVTVLRTGATSQLAYGFGGLGTFSSFGSTFTQRSAPAETLSGVVAITVKAISSGGVANTVLCDFATVEFLP